MENNKIIKGFLYSLVLFLSACTSIKTVQTDIGSGWNNNSVNTVKFRKNALTTHNEYQFTAYYDENSCLILAKRKVNSSDWEKVKTPYKGNTKDAHNDISIAIDDNGFLHVSWDHHDTKLRYAKSIKPMSLELGEEQPMTGQEENKVTYPQFYNLPNGNLLFFYRSGASGRGNMVINSYDLKSRNWSQLQRNLLDGEEKRSAYWQSSIDQQGIIHLSWVWRESGDVATNHDMCYARSDDGGKTWVKSDGTPYALPITMSTAEIAHAIPQKHELINQTSMCTDGKGRPVIATYFRPEGTEVVQYFVIRHDGKAWQTSQVSNRTGKFSLSGGGSKQIPIARPQVVARTAADGTTAVHVIYRDVGANSGRAVVTSCVSIEHPTWTTRELTDFDVKYWEPRLDRVRWARDGVLNLYVQAAGQGDGETLQDVKPQTAYVLEWRLGKE